MNGYEIAKAYSKGELCGWLEKRQPGIAKAQFDLLNGAGKFKSLSVPKKNWAAGRKHLLYKYTRQVLGKDTENYPQQIGDCVSFGAKNAGEYVSCSQILAKALAIFGADMDAVKDFVAKARMKFRPIFAPYYYGTGRVYVGNNQIRGDGSLGSWMAEGVRRFGTVFADEAGIPKYSGAVATAWGDRNSAADLDKWRDYGSQYLIRSAAPITTWEQLVTAIGNGYPCPTASDIGYSMEPGQDGFHVQNDEWPHQMCFIATDDTYKNGEEPYALCLNNWGDVHGHLKDFDDGHDLPVGVLRVRRRDVEKHLRQGETYAYSQFDGFPEQRLDKALFKLI